LNPGSHNIKINDPTPRLNNLINPGFGDGALEIPKKHLKNQESATAPSGLPKFDLNELPYDMDPGNSHGFGGGNFKPESERDYSQTFKRQKIDPAHRSLRPTNLKFPLANVGVESGFEEVASNQAQKINEPGIFREARDYYTNKVSKIQPERNFDHKNGKEHSLIIFKEIFSSSSERDSAGYETKNIKRKVIDELEDQYSSSESKGKSKIASDEKYESEIIIKRFSDLVESFKNFLSVEIKNSGPFDMEGKGAYFSPYNRNLLNFLDSNLENILTGELNEYIITNDFFQTIKTTFWDENKGIFL
ncbi:expressed protein, partial [Phakopsora pachyrhizi]